MSGTPIAYVNSTDVPLCRHSTLLWARSSSSPLIFLQNTRCSTHTYHSRRQKLCCRRTARVEQFTIREITSYGQFRQHLKTHLFRAQKSQRIVTVQISALYKYSYLLTYLLNAVGLTSIQYRRQRQISVVHARSDISSEARSPLVSSSSSSIGWPRPAASNRVLTDDRTSRFPPFFQYWLIELSPLAAAVLTNEGRVLHVAWLERFCQHGDDLLAVSRVGWSRVCAGAEASTATWRRPHASYLNTAAQTTHTQHTARTVSLSHSVMHSHKYQLSQMDPRDALPPAHGAVDDQCDKWMAKVVGRTSTVASTVNRRPLPVYHTEHPPLTVELSSQYVATVDVPWRNFRSPEFWTKFRLLLEIRR